MTIFDNKMMNTQYTYHKSKQKKWLLTVTLLFSIFSILGYSGNLQSKNKQTTQTELVISSNYKPYKQHAVSYKKVYNSIVCNDYITSTSCSWKNAILSYNQQTKIRYNNISRQFNSYKAADCFLNVKTIPQSSDEDIFATFIG